MTDHDPLESRHIVRQLFAVYVEGDARKRVDALELVLIQGMSYRKAASETGLGRQSVARLVESFRKAVEQQDDRLLTALMELTGEC